MAQVESAIGLGLWYGPLAINYIDYVFLTTALYPHSTGFPSEVVIEEALAQITWL